MRVYWLPLLARGKLHVEGLPEGFPGDTPEGAETLVGKLPGVLARRFPNGAHPKLVMTVRGNGFFHSSSGKITPLYKAALDEAGLSPAPPPPHTGSKIATMQTGLAVAANQATPRTRRGWARAAKLCA